MNFAQAAARVADLRAQIKAQEEEIEDLFASFPQFSRIDSYPAGDYIVKVVDNRRFDPATAQANLSATKVKSISVLRPDATLARKVLSGSDYERCQKSVGLKRFVTAVSDED